MDWLSDCWKTGKTNQEGFCEFCFVSVKFGSSVLCNDLQGKITVFVNGVQWCREQYRGVYTGDAGAFVTHLVNVAYRTIKKTAA